jgi:hypothetical protein
MLNVDPEDENYKRCLVVYFLSSWYLVPKVAPVSIMLSRVGEEVAMKSTIAEAALKLEPHKRADSLIRLPPLQASRTFHRFSTKQDENDLVFGCRATYQKISSDTLKLEIQNLGA